MRIGFYARARASQDAAGRLDRRRLVRDEDRTATCWTVAEAKAHLSEVLRLTQSDGPHCIGTRRSFVVVPADAGDNKANLHE